MNESEFKKHWLSGIHEGEPKGLALLLEPKPDFYAEEGEEVKKNSFRFLFRYLRNYKKFISQLILGIFLSGILLLIFPFLTQAIVDYGINYHDKNFIFLILIAQLVLIISKQSVEFIRGWIILHLSTRVNIFLISDFLIKLMKLPIGFFDTKLVGDLLQRIGDHRRVESFLTSTSLDILFSMFTLVIFGIVLAIYSITIFIIFVLGSLLYYLWINIFMKKRRELDYKRFSKQSENQGKLIQIINGIEEIKLNNAEKKLRWEWEEIQASLFKVNVRNLSLNQYQQAGAVLINEAKNILITFLAAIAVVDGNMTIGMMLAISFILGQLNTPLNRLIGFMGTAQDAKISLERLAEIHENKDEDSPELSMNLIPGKKGIQIQNLSFRYEGPHSPYVLKDLNLELPENSITAIVGVSGSGKSTLIKLLLGYYAPTGGDIRIGDQSIQNLNNSAWRRKCGVVLQNGYIFSDSIAKNIAFGEETIDNERLIKSARIANINEFVEKLPLGYNTRVGQEG